MLTNRCAFGAVGAAIEGVIKGRLLPGPDTILNLGNYAAAYLTVSTDRLDLLRTTFCRCLRFGFFHHAGSKAGSKHGPTCHQAGVAQK